MVIDMRGVTLWLTHPQSICEAPLYVNVLAGARVNTCMQCQQQLCQCELCMHNTMPAHRHSRHCSLMSWLQKCTASD